MNATMQLSWLHAVSNLSVEPLQQVFASDGSKSKGAVCSIPVSSKLGLDFWLRADFRVQVRLAPCSRSGYKLQMPDNLHGLDAAPFDSSP